jgi:hypothetical protein
MQPFNANPIERDVTGARYSLFVWVVGGWCCTLWNTAEARAAEEAKDWQSRGVATRIRVTPIFRGAR